MKSSLSRIGGYVFAVLGLAGCGGEDDNQDAEGASALLARIRTEDYRSWQRAPGYETRRQSSAPHGDEVDVFVNGTLAAALAGPAISAWPRGSVVAKDGYKGTSLHLIAIMEKRADGWFYAELDGSGTALYSGRPSACTDCHAAGSDNLRAFTLPR